MPDTFTMTWNGNPIGELTDVANDMWFINGKWKSSDTPAAREFETLLRNFDSKTLEADPVANSIKVVLHSNQYADSRLYCLAMSLNENEIDLRMVVGDEELDRFFPNR
jgi:hypothetical protein